jgi:hypothetical protein
MPLIDDFQQTSYQSDPTFNTLKTLPMVGYACIMYLLEHNELVWKLLKYNEADAWQKSDLTLSEKMALIYNGIGEQNNFRVFMDEGQLDVWNKQACVLRIFPVEIFPVNQVMSDIYIAFQVLSYYEINHLTNYQTRVDTIIAEIVNTFNGALINGLGQIVFDRNSFPRCKMSPYGIKPFNGRMLTLAFNYTSNIK